MPHLPRRPPPSIPSPHQHHQRSAPTHTDETSCFPSPYSTHNSTPSCSGWGQFVDVTPLERGPCSPSHAELRFSPYGAVWRRRLRACSVSDSMEEVDGGDWGMEKLGHSASTDGISSALVNVRISGVE